MPSRFTEKWRPRKVILVQPQSSFCDAINLNFEKCFLSIRNILVFSLFIHNPDILPKINATSKECCVPLKSIVPSSNSTINKV